MDEYSPARLGPPARDDFEAAYAGAPPWDIGRPQPAFVALAEAGLLAGRVLDPGCGTGEHTLMAARLGHESVGVDIAPTAIALAEAKLTRLAGEPAGLPARFTQGDVRHLPALSLGHFDTVIDSGVFHVFDDPDRAAYVASLHDVLRPGAHVFLLCFSEREPGTWGPRRITQADLRTAFSAAGAWTVESISTSTFTIRRTQPDAPPLAQAWLADIRRD